MQNIMCGSDPNLIAFQEPRFHESRVNIPKDIRIQIVELLNQTLATSIDLQSQIKQATWNMRGNNFYQFYLLLNEMSKQIEDHINTISERISTLASTPLISVRVAAKNSQLPEFSFDAFTIEENLHTLANRVSLHGKFIKVAIDQVTDLEDAVTADIYIKFSRVLDRHLWLLESHVLPE